MNKNELIVLFSALNVAGKRGSGHGWDAGDAHFAVSIAERLYDELVQRGYVKPEETK